MSVLLAESADIRDAYLSMNDDDLTDDQVLILSAFFTGLMRIVENRLVQARLGTIDYADLKHFGARSSTYRQPFFRRFWERQRDQFSPELQKYVEQEILPQEELPLLNVQKQ